MTLIMYWHVHMYPSLSTDIKVGAYEFLRGVVYWCDSQSVNKKVHCIKTTKSSNKKPHECGA